LCKSVNFYVKYYKMAAFEQQHDPLQWIATQASLPKEQSRPYQTPGPSWSDDDDDDDDDDDSFDVFATPSQGPAQYPQQQQ